MTPTLRIALDTPLRQLFDYRAPPGVDPAGLVPGVRVRVPFGRRRMVGVLMETAEHASVPLTKLKAAIEILDTEPVLDAAMLSFVRWAAEYYHHPMGEVLAAALPVSVRTAKAAAEKVLHPAAQDGDVEKESTPGSSAAAEVPSTSLDAPLAGTKKGQEWKTRAGLELTGAQADVLKEIFTGLGRFGCNLLYGVTGSGKTEVYLRAIQEVLERGQQALVLVPEIGLTPQLLERFKARFDAPLVVMHSALGDKARLTAWQKARSGEAAIVIGTRSAIFTPLARPGLIVVDEEHDGSYKQQEGFRYSARDLAVVRAHRQNVLVILGSATPSLETIENAREERYRKLVLPERPGEARHPTVRLVDLRSHAVTDGLATPTLASIEGHLRDGGQVLVYLNRRGYAPTLFCPGCGWVAPCKQCDARLTVHLRSRTLSCHHCGFTQKLPFGCPTCGHEVKPVGQGTERAEETLTMRFPDAPLVRFDRDSVKRKGDMQAVLDRVHSGEARILLGTQMLTKGHHFPDVTLVVVVNADHGLFSVDFRASERLAQTIVQVSGRAGRASKPGEVLIQTEFPQHALLQKLLTAGYDGFADAALEERAAAHWPPFSRLALLRADARSADGAMNFLKAAADSARTSDTVRMLGPVPATMARRAGYHRAQLLIESASRGQLHRFLDAWLPAIETLPAARGVRWSLDVDPADLY